MNYEQFFRDVQAGLLRPVYLLYGEEQFVKARAIERLREKLLPPGLAELNEAVFEGGGGASGATAVQITDAAEMLPVMAERRLVLVNDWAPLIAGKSRDESGETDRMTAWLENPPDTCCLVFSLRVPPDGRKKMVTALKKRAEVVEFPLLGDPQIEKWLNQALRPVEKRIAHDAVAPLIFMAGRSLTGLNQELAKLAAYVGERAIIARSDVEEIVTPSAESTIFQMIDALMERRPDAARRLLKSLLERGETNVGALVMITRQMRMIAHIKLMRAKGVSLAEIERALALNHYAASSAARQAERFSADAAEEGYRACVEADFAIKSGRMRDETALDQLMWRLQEVK